MLSILGTCRLVAPRKQVVWLHVFGCRTEIPDFQHRRGDAPTLPRGAPSRFAKTHLEIRNDVLTMGDAAIADGVTDLITSDEYVSPARFRMAPSTSAHLDRHDPVIPFCLQLRSNR